MADPVAVVCVKTETSSELQTRSDELQILFQGDVALQVVAPVLIVTRLCSRYKYFVQTDRMESGFLERWSC